MFWDKKKEKKEEEGQRFYKYEGYEQFLTNRFLVVFVGTDIPFDQVVWFWDDNTGGFTVKFRDCTRFYAPAFFEKEENQLKDATVKVYLVDTQGYKRVVKTYTGVKFERCLSPCLDYFRPEPLMTSVDFLYEKVTHEILENKE